MKWCWSFLLSAPLLLAQSGPVQLVGNGNAQARFADPFAASRNQYQVKTTVTSPGNNGKFLTFDQYVAQRARQQHAQPSQERATSPEAAEAWVRKYAPPSQDDTAADPSLPKFSTTVTLHQTSRKSGGSENVIPRFATTLLRNMMIDTSALPPRGSFGRK